MNLQFKTTIGVVGSLTVLLAAEVGLGALGIGITTANACETAASPPATVDCDGIQHASLSMATYGAVDGQGWIAGQGVEDYDGTHGEFCSAIFQSVPRC